MLGNHVNTHNLFNPLMNSLWICFLRQRSSWASSICIRLFSESLEVPTSFNDGTLEFWGTYNIYLASAQTITTSQSCPSFGMIWKPTESKEPCQPTNHQTKICRVENPAAAAISFCVNKPSGEILKERSSRSNGKFLGKCAVPGQKDLEGNKWQVKTVQIVHVIVKSPDSSTTKNQQKATVGCKSFWQVVSNSFRKLVSPTKTVVKSHTEPM